MKDYIERAEVEKLVLATALVYGGEPDQYTLFLDNLKKIPAADVVEVVRCFQCAHHEENGYHWCNKWEHILPDDSDFFCKWGRKKEAADAN